MYKVEAIKNGQAVKYAEDIEKAEIVLVGGEWDMLRFSADGEKYIRICIAPAAQEAVVYVPDGVFEFKLPDEQHSRGFEPEIFNGELTVYAAKAENEYRDLALNPYDIFLADEVVPWDAPEWANPEQSPAAGAIKQFPHAYASRVTRDEGCFYARNAIDGVSGVGGHGSYPFHSWGGGVHEDLSIAVYFGRKVMVDKLLLNLRSDYKIYVEDLEHDTYWKSATLEFSDGSSITVEPQKTEKDQIFEFEPKETDWVILKKLVPYVNPKGQNFAALNRIGVFGKEI